MVVHMLFFCFRILLMASWNTSFPKKYVSQNERRNYQPKKNQFIVKMKKKVSKVKETFAFFILQFWAGFCRLSNFLYFFFPWLIINQKHKCIQAKALVTQVSWSLDSYIH